MGLERVIKQPEVCQRRHEVDQWDTSLEYLVKDGFFDVINYIISKYILDSQTDEAEVFDSSVEWLFNGLASEDVTHSNVVTTVIAVMEKLQSFPTSVQNANVSYLPNYYQWNEDIDKLVRPALAEICYYKLRIVIDDFSTDSDREFLLLQISRFIDSGKYGTRFETIDFIVSRLFYYYYIALMQRALCSDPGNENKILRQFQDHGFRTWEASIYMRRPE
ncbi:MAG: hypothetical protein U9Q67_01255 [Patescibacteria group bacterium]|nr:hypothetical protein [Patescibacteria group bacterium]